ncbi:MAG: SigB/SigF/SigG family RNA polymerase sigma factor [Baekduia sp.]
MTYVNASPRTSVPGRSRPARERFLLERIHRHGDAQARDELVELMLPLVRHIARSFAGRGEQLDDLVQVGALGLIKAIDRFDLDREVRLSTFASPTIAGEIKRHFRDRTWSLRTPRDLQELYARVRERTADFEATHGRSPTIGELAEATGHDEEQVLDALAAGSNMRTASLDTPVDDNAQTIGDVIGTRDEGFDRAEARAVVAEGLKKLEPREQRIIALHYAAGLTQREIAAQVGISQMHVSRLLRRSVETMREELV